MRVCSVDLFLCLHFVVSFCILFPLLIVIEDSVWIVCICFVRNFYVHRLLCSVFVVWFFCVLYVWACTRFDFTLWCVRLFLLKIYIVCDRRSPCVTSPVPTTQRRPYHRGSFHFASLLFRQWACAISHCDDCSHSLQLPCKLILPLFFRQNVICYHVLIVICYHLVAYRSASFLHFSGAILSKCIHIYIIFHLFMCFCFIVFFLCCCICWRQMRSPILHRLASKNSHGMSKQCFVSIAFLNPSRT